MVELAEPRENQSDARTAIAAARGAGEKAKQMAVIQ